MPDSTWTIPYDTNNTKPLYENGIKIADVIVTTTIPEGIIVAHPITYAMLNNRGWDM